MYYYLIIISSSFGKSSLEEIRRIADFKIVEEFVTTLIIESKEKRLAEKLLDSNPIFVYNIFELSYRFPINQADYINSLFKGMLKEVPRRKQVKIECFDVNSKIEHSAKDIEVYLGERLEKKGYKIDLANPQSLVYLVLINMRCYVGHADYRSMKKKFINPERHYHPYSGESVSRSELKLIQAFDEFEINGKGTAVDIGAAPGGWSRFLVSSGFKVIAIDNGALDYKKFKKLKIRVKVLSSSSGLASELKKYDIIQIKKNAKNVSLGRARNVSLIVDDMNVPPNDSARILLRFSKSLAKNAKMIMTVKCIDRKAEKHIRKAINSLRGRFKIKGVRVLPSNRQELTLYAVYKETK